MSYVVMPSQDGAIIAVALMACAFSVALSAGLTYTCTSGTFDFDEFDSDVCFQLPEEDTGGGSGAGAGGGGGAGGGSVAPFVQSSDPSELQCTGFFADSMTTCYTPGEGRAGLRWDWIEGDESEECKSKTVNYSVTVSSSQDNHQAKFRFPALPGGENNAFNFHYAPEGWMEGQNVKFYLSALNSSGEAMGPEVMATLDANNSMEECNAHGDPVHMNQASHVGIDDPTGGDSVPPPTDCIGGTWSEWGPCMSDGKELDTFEDCGQTGVHTRTLSDYTPAAHGGTCKTEDTQTCYTAACPEATPDIQDCIMGSWTSVLGTSTVGTTLYEDSVTGAKSCSAKCSTTHFGGASYPGGAVGGGTREEVRDVIVPRGADGGAECGAVVNTNACNTHDCPRDCIGAWADDPSKGTVRKCSGKWEYDHKTQVYTISQSKLGSGQACGPSHGDTRLVNTTNNRECCPGECCASPLAGCG